MLLTKSICMQKIWVNQKYEYLIKKREDAEIKHVNNPNAFIVCSNAMDDVYEGIDNYNRKRDKKKS